MDPQHAKRPRSSTPSKGGADARKKKKKTKKSKNNDPSSTADGATATAAQEKHRPHHKDTATADGHIMAQMLTTFSSLEQSRFQAFKRATFQADAVEAWVAACLQDRYGDNTCSSAGSTAQTQTRKLEDLVAPGQAHDIGLVVAMAGKIYAQRLVSEAVSMHEKERSKNNKNDNSSNSTSTTLTAAAAGGTPSCTALPPSAVYQAVEARRRRGVDPGFFLQPATEPWNWAAAAASFDVRRLAAEHAQAEYEKRWRQQKQQQQQQRLQQQSTANDKDGDAKMPSSSSSSS